MKKHTAQECHHHRSLDTTQSLNMLYTCPMHPEIQKQGPGACPICGMALEPINNTKNMEDDSEYRDMLHRFWVAIIFSVPLFILNMGMHFSSQQWLQAFTHNIYFNWLQFILATPVVVWCGWPFFDRGWHSLVSKSLNMFTLIALGVGTAYVYSIVVTLIPHILVALLGNTITLDVYYEPAAIITVLVLVGQILELKARSQTNKSIQQLLDLTPSTATLIYDDHSEKEVLISEIKVGDLIRIRPGDKIPVDGIVINGSSAINESMMTGEAMPNEKDVGAFVIAGTLNGTGSFIMKATKVGADTLLSQIVDMVSKAQRTKAHIQKLADQVASYFVPIVILVAVLTFVLWTIFGPEPRIGYAILTSVAVLIIACPCALGLATPMSIMVGTGRGAREGVLIKNAEALETLAKVNALVLDKTGTLTEGKPSLVDIISTSKEYSKKMLLQLAASLEQGSEHPLAAAVLQSAKSQAISLQECGDFQSITGKGVIGKITEIVVALGNSSLMDSLNIDITSVEQDISKYKALGQTIMFIALNNTFSGYLIVADKIKPDALQVISEFKKRGINVFMLTGDNSQTAHAIATQVGITEVEAEVLPQNKFKYVQALQDKGFIVAMAGDGINDAPALTQANVGIAMGNGADIAMESAGIILVHGNLTAILRAIRLSGDTIRNIKQNLFFAFIYNIVLVPVAAGILYPVFGWLLSPVIASVAMAFSSVSVILNALRLKKAG